MKQSAKRKRLASLAVTLCTSAALVACGGAAAGGGAEASSTPAEEQTAPAEVNVQVVSDLVGLIDTFGKTSAKNDTIFSSGPGDQTLRYYNDAGERVAFDDQDAFHENPGMSYTGSAVITLDGAEDDKIDASAAIVRVVDNGVYRGSDYVLSDAASTLSGTWENGSYTYTLEPGDLELNQYGLGDALENPNTGRRNSGYEWTTMGGDGNGVYYLSFEVSGLKYDGEELPAVTFPVDVFCYGRDNSGIADLTRGYEPLAVDGKYESGIEPASDVQWNWDTENEAALEDGRPYMNDTYTDYITVVWPEGSDASGVTADDVVVTLDDEYGHTYALSEMTPYGELEYGVLASEAETTVAVTYEQWSLWPAYSSMTVSVDAGDLVAEQTFEIASVSGSATAQTGGGEQDGVPYVTVHSYNGVDGWEIGDGVNVTYTLSVEDGGKTYYYDGKALVDASTLPVEEKVNPWNGETVEELDLSSVTQVIESEAADEYGILEYHVIGVGGGHSYTEGTNLEPMTVEVDVDGKTYEMTVNVSVEADPAGHLLPGYNLESSVMQWSYLARYQSGWLQDYSPKPTGLPYVDAYHGFTSDEDSNPVYAEAVAAAEEAAANGGGMGGPGGPGAGGPGAGGPTGGGPDGDGPDGGPDDGGE